jgi:hypothetical protein
MNRLAQVLLVGATRRVARWRAALRTSRRLVPTLLAAGCLLLPGCAGYRVGPVGKLSYRSVAVPMFKNETHQPQLEAQITNAIIKRFQADGTLRVESEPAAEVVVRGRIIQYGRAALRYVQTDVRTAREYRITITALIEVRNARTGEVVLKPTTLTGNADTFVGSDLQSAEQQVLPLVADDLARQVVNLLAESW